MPRRNIEERVREIRVGHIRKDLLCKTREPEKLKIFIKAKCGYLSTTATHTCTGLMRSGEGKSSSNTLDN